MVGQVEHQRCVWPIVSCDHIALQIVLVQWVHDSKGRLQYIGYTALVDILVDHHVPIFLQVHGYDIDERDDTRVPGFTQHFDFVAQRVVVVGWAELEIVGDLEDHIVIRTV